VPKIYAYCRVSHEKSAKSGLGIEVQIEQLQWWAKANASRLPDHTWGKVSWRGVKQAGTATTDGFFVDQAVSALRQKFRFRPAGSRLHGVLNPGDIIVIAKLDRGFRNSHDLSNTLFAWNEMGVSVSFLDVGLDTTTPIGKMVITILGAVAQMDSDLKSERAKEVHARLKSTGRPTAGRGSGPGKKRKSTPEGMKYDEPQHYECLECQWIVSLHDDLSYSFSAIAETLEEKRAVMEGRERWPIAPYRGHKNRRWSVDSVKDAYRAAKAGKIPAPDLTLLTDVQKQMPLYSLKPIKKASPQTKKKKEQGE
jgi:DNA invertase Pin-like site-specific DNA recombinase